MTESTQEAPSTTEQPQTWEAPQYEAALAHLERLQAQIDKLRSTIPSLVSPLAQPSAAASKAQVFAGVRKSALQSAGDLKTFREDWTSEQTRDLFARSKESLERVAGLERSGEVARYGWVSEKGT